MNKKFIYGACALAIAATSFTSCSDEQDVLSNGEGQLFISTKVDNDVRVVSRAAAELTQDLSDKLIVWISNSKGAVVRKYNNDNALPSTGISLVGGSYVAEAWTGDSVSAAWDTKYYKAREEFTINSGSNTNVDLVCKVANSVVSVVYSDEVQQMLNNRSITVNHSRAELTFDDEHAADKGYFMMPTIEDESGNKVKESTLHWSLSGKRVNGTDVYKSGDITDVKSGYHYILSVSYTQKDSEDIGGGMFTIEVKEEPITVENEFTITMAPRIEGYGDYLDLSQPIYAETGSVDKKSIFAAVSGTEFKSFQLNTDILTDYANFEVSSVDILTLTDEDKTNLEAKGISFTTYSDETNNYAWIKLSFSTALLSSLSEGTHSIEVTATDMQGLSTTATLVLHLTDAVVVTNEVEDYNVWASHATVTANIIKQDKLAESGASIKYRVKGTQQWTDATSSTSDKTVTATLTGLTPGTTYQYVAFNGDEAALDVQEFTTETAAQLPNCGFEDGFKSNGINYLYAQDGEMFWDSGNTGGKSASMFASETNTTTISTVKKHSGNSSVRMESLYLVVKFAAGSAFVGKYLGTEGTNGILGWGRAWTSKARPTKLKGYLHYTPVAVDNTADACPLAKGELDQGMIYIALLDDSTDKTTYSSDTSWPVIIRTQTSHLFSKDDANVIAYGEKVLDSATSGDEMIPFEIDLSYYRTDIKPSNIMVTMSSSRYGDYFAGGKGSTLYVDDLELVYE